MGYKFNYEQLKGFFPPVVEEESRADFHSRCVSCNIPLGPGEGHCIPILQEPRMWHYSEEHFYASSCEVRGLPNTQFACDTCRRLLADPDSRDWSRLGVFFPCIPVLNYIAYVLQSLRSSPKEERMKTVDQILLDLEKYPDLTPERRAAAPFLDCFELYPRRRCNSQLPPEFTQVHVHNAPPAVSINGRSYRIIDSTTADDTLTKEPDSVLKISLYKPRSDDTDTTVLWRIRRSTGLYLACAAAVWPQDAGHKELYKAYLAVMRSTLFISRGLADEDVVRAPAVTKQFLKPQKELEASPPVETASPNCGSAQLKPPAPQTSYALVGHSTSQESQASGTTDSGFWSDDQPAPPISPVVAIMPMDRSKTISNDEDSSLGTFLVLEYVSTSGRSKGFCRKLLVPHYTDYEAMIAHCKHKISALKDVPNNKLALRSRNLPGHEREMVEIDKDSYTKAILHLNNVEVFVLEDDG
ncbi:hypothetical protein PENSPDRAFT_736223 [Peniophora sp. CONT]|nr:hypothetical protein PENSPDRAFT_736223 [Peniophora sp. CONT]